MQKLDRGFADMVQLVGAGLKLQFDARELLARRMPRGLEDRGGFPTSFVELAFRPGLRGRRSRCDAGGDLAIVSIGGCALRLIFGLSDGQE